MIGMDIDDPLSGQVLLACDSWSTCLYLYSPYILLILGLIVVAGLVSAAEAAFFSLSPDDQHLCRQTQAMPYQRIAALLERPKRLLATLVILNNLVNISIVVIISLLSIYALQQSVWIGGAVVLTTTLLLVLFGEMIPKVYASQNNLRVALKTGFWVKIGVWVFRPLSVLLVSLSNQIDKRIERRGYKLTVEELNQAVELTSTEATEEEKEMLKGIVNFSNQTARQVMQSRANISAVSRELSFTELLEHIRASSYSRLPVYQTSLDHIEGILYSKDLLPHLQRDDTFRWQILLRPAFFIPENKRIDDLLQDFQKRRVHIAIVVDEYGATRGLVTLEDIIEEIFGDIDDEFDEESEQTALHPTESTYVVEAQMPLVDVCRLLNIEPTTFDAVQGNSETLAGLMLELFGRLPNPNDQITYKTYTFTILAADEMRIEQVQIDRKPEDDYTQSPLPDQYA